MEKGTMLPGVIFLAALCFLPYTLGVNTNCSFTSVSDMCGFSVDSGDFYWSQSEDRKLHMDCKNIGNHGESAVIGTSSLNFSTPHCMNITYGTLSLVEATFSILATPSYSPSLLLDMFYMDRDLGPFTEQVNLPCGTYSIELNGTCIDNRPRYAVQITEILIYPCGYVCSGNGNGSYGNESYGYGNGGNESYPGGNESYPGGYEGYPGGNESYPGGNESYPGGYEGYPGGNESYPGGNESYPGGNESYPGGNESYPGGNERYPGGYEGYPGGNESYPGGNESYPGENEGYGNYSSGDGGGYNGYSGPEGGYGGYNGSGSGSSGDGWYGESGGGDYYSGYGSGDSYSGSGDPYGGSGDPYGGSGDPYGGSGDPYGGSGDPYGGSGDPYGGSGDLYEGSGEGGYSGSGDGFSGPVGESGDGELLAELVTPMFCNFMSLYDNCEMKSAPSYDVFFFPSDGLHLDCTSAKAGSNITMTTTLINFTSPYTASITYEGGEVDGRLSLFLMDEADVDILVAVTVDKGAARQTKNVSIPVGIYVLSVYGECLDVGDLAFRISHLQWDEASSCTSDSCSNGGSCFENDDGEIKCTCPLGWIGEFCQIADPCGRRLCQNNATCVEGKLKTFNDFSCTCPTLPGSNMSMFTGDYCETSVPLEDLMGDLNSLALSGDASVVTAVVGSIGNVLAGENKTDEEKGKQVEAASQFLLLLSSNAKDIGSISAAASGLGSISGGDVKTLGAAAQDNIMQAAGSLVENLVNSNISMSKNQLKDVASSVMRASGNVLNAAVSSDGDSAVPDKDAAKRAEEGAKLVDNLAELIVSNLGAGDAVVVKTPMVSIVAQKKTPAEMAKEPLDTDQGSVALPPNAFSINEPVIAKVVSHAKNPYISDNSSKDLGKSSVMNCEVKSAASGNPIQLDSGKSLDVEMDIDADTDALIIDATNFTDSRGSLLDYPIESQHQTFMFTLELPESGIFKLRGKFNADASLVDSDYSITMNVDGVTQVEGGLTYKDEGGVITFIVPSSIVPDTGKMTLLVTKENDPQEGNGVLQIGRRRLLAATNTSLNIGLKTVVVIPKYYDKNTKQWKTSSQVQLSTNSSKTKAVFKSNFFGSFAAGLVEPPNTIDFDKVFSNFGALLLENPYVLIFMCCLVALYVLMVVLCRRQDKHDQRQWEYGHLVQNDRMDTHHYLLTIHTSSKSLKNTTAKLYLILYGTEGRTGPRILMDNYRSHFQRGTVSNFVLSTPISLGKLTHAHIWHCGLDDSDSYKLEKIVVNDIRTKTKYFFLCNRWLAINKDDGKTDRIMTAATEEDMNNFGWLMANHVTKGMFEDHLWFSVAKRPNPSRLTRVQRLSAILSVFFLCMITNAMWYKEEEDSSDGIAIGPITITFRQVWVGLMSSVIVVPPTLVILESFRRSKPRNQNRSIWPYERHTTKSDEKKNDKKLSKVQGKYHVALAAMKAFKKKSYLESGVIIDESKLDLPERELEELEAKEEEEIRLKSKPLRFPWWFVFIGYIMVFLSTATSMFFTLLYSLDWGKDKSLNWLMSMFFSFTESVIIVQPFKVVIVAMIMSCVMSLPGDDQDEDDYSVAEHKMLPPFFRMPQPAFIPNQSITVKEEDKELKRIAKKRDKKLYNTVRDIFIHLLYLFLMIFICYANRDPNFFLQTDLLKTSFGLDEDTYADVGRIEDVYAWLNETIIPAAFPQDDYRGDGLSAYDLQFLADSDSLRLGPMRVRQIRVKKGMCTVVEPLNLLFNTCDSAYTSSHEDKGFYAAGWVPVSNISLADDAFTYQDLDGPNDLSVSGTVDNYPPGGYIVAITSFQDGVNKINALFDDNWIDRYTRAVVVELTVNNAYVNIFAMMRVIVEFPEIGGIFMRHEVTAFRPYPYVEAFDFVLLIIQAIWYIIVIYLFVVECIKIYKLKCIYYFKNLWHLMEITDVTLALTSLLCFVMRTYYTIKSVEDVKNSEGKYVGFDLVSNWDYGYTMVIGCDIFVATLQLFRPLDFSFHLAVLKSALRYSFTQVCSYLFIFIIFMIGFGSCVFMYIGRQAVAFHNLGYSLFNLFGITLGVISYSDSMPEDTAVLKLMFAVYTMTMNFLLLNMFVSIINETLADVQYDESKQHYDREMSDHMMGKITNWITAVFRSEDPEKKAASRLMPVLRRERTVRFDFEPAPLPWEEPRPPPSRRSMRSQLRSRRGRRVSFSEPDPLPWEEGYSSRPSSTSPRYSLTSPVAVPKVVVSFVDEDGTTLKGRATPTSEIMVPWSTNFGGKAKGKRGFINIQSKSGRDYILDHNADSGASDSKRPRPKELDTAFGMAKMVESQFFKFMQFFKKLETPKERWVRIIQEVALRNRKLKVMRTRRLLKEKLKRSRKGAKQLVNELNTVIEEGHKANILSLEDEEQILAKEEAKIRRESNKLVEEEIKSMQASVEVKNEVPQQKREMTRRPSSQLMTAVHGVDSSPSTAVADTESVLPGTVTPTESPRKEAELVESKEVTDEAVDVDESERKEKKKKRKKKDKKKDKDKADVGETTPVETGSQNSLADSQTELLKKSA